MNAKVVGSDKHRDDSSSKNWLACNERDGDILEQGVEEEKGPQLNQNSNKNHCKSFNCKSKAQEKILQGSFWRIQDRNRAEHQKGSWETLS